MKKKYLLSAIFLTALSYWQLGINNLTQKSTLDVTSETTDGSLPKDY